LRASNADREQVIGTLKAAFVQGMLAKEEFDLRVGQTFAAPTCARLAAITADLPAGLAMAKPPKVARVQGEPRIPRPGRVLAVATAVCAAMWLVAFSLPVSGPDHDSPAGLTLAVTATFFYMMLLLMAGTPPLADWLNKHW
jgi:peptidoglycan/LPS O-acetylase OafA/YrhL